MFFLTAVDTERLDIRGSRDPLGVVPLWGDYGRDVVHNLTTPSNSVRNFTTLLVGLHFAEQIAVRAPDREKARLEAFLKFEQLAGYARLLRNNQSDAIRGITQLKSRLAEHSSRRVRIGSAREFQILGNQKTYGVWGLFIQPAIASGLVAPKELVLTPVARELIDRHCLPRLRANGLGDGERLVEILSKPSAELEPDGKHAKVFDALGQMLVQKLAAGERDTYYQHLVLGGPSAPRTGWQLRFVELMEANLDRGEFTLASLAGLIAAARKDSDEPLRAHLGQVRDLEGLLVAIGNLFDFLQHRDRAAMADVVSDVRKVWGRGLRHIKHAAITAMAPRVAKVYGDKQAGERFSRIATALNTGDYADAVDAVFEHNRFVMATRNGSQPWIQVANGKLDVRYRDNVEKGLRDPQSLSTGWRSTFYFNPLKIVSDELRVSGR